MRTWFVWAVAVFTLSSVLVPLGASAQESAAEFNRREWQRANGGNFFGGTRSTVTAPRRAAPVQRPAPSPPPRDFFSALFGEQPAHRSSAPDSRSDSRRDRSLDRGSTRARITITPASRSATGSSGSGYSSGSGEPRRSRTRGERSYAGGGTKAFCVRSCDGRYFPLQGQPRGADDPNAVSQCAAFCPAADTEVFFASDSEKGIEGAENKNGKSYSSTPNAYAFRERIVTGCSCTSDGRVAGIGRIDVLHDPTLKRGDIVMTSDGAKVFTGKKSRPPFRDHDFVAPQRFPELPRSLRRRIAELTVL